MIEMMTVISEGRELEFPQNAVASTTKFSTIDKIFLEDELRPLEEYIGEKEKEYLKKAYIKCGTTRKLAEILGVNHSTIIRKMKKYGINATKEGYKHNE